MVEPISRDLAAIRERGTLVVLAPYNSTTYFIYQGEPLGYEYELLQTFAKRARGRAQDDCRYRPQESLALVKI